MGEIKEINQKDQISNVYEVERTKQVSMSNQPSLNFRGISKVSYLQIILFNNK